MRFILTAMLIASFLVVAPPAQAESYKSQIVQLVNEARSEGRYCGSTYYPAVKPVKSNKKLKRAAGRHARDMANNDYFSHYTRSGKSPGWRIRKAGYRWRSYGEDIAAGQRTPQKVVQAWLDSPGHCRVIMRARYRHIGVGIAYNQESRYKIYWVIDLARKR